MLLRKSLLAVARENLERKYLTSRDYYNVKIVNDIIYNENAHIVSVFKDYLIYDDVSEFLKRFYAEHEAVTRLPKIYDFYDKYSKVLSPQKIIYRSSQTTSSFRKTNTCSRTSSASRVQLTTSNELSWSNSSSGRAGPHQMPRTQYHKITVSSPLGSINPCSGLKFL